MNEQRNAHLFAGIAILLITATISMGAIWIYYTKANTQAEKSELEAQKLHWQIEGKKMQAEINYLQQFLPKTGSEA